jgi:predicted 3-demethylubiquinone-9 3-methyltransferase (glyoxalase superfamily)
MKGLITCLWFDGQAEEAAEFYVSIFPNSAIAERNPAPGAPADSPPLTVDFCLDGRPFVALNGGPQFTFSEAVSIQVMCETQDELDHYWDHLGAGGDENARQCGWLKDRFGLSWQIVPVQLPALLTDPDQAKATRVMQAMLQMQKLDIDALEAAARDD